MKKIYFALAAVLTIGMLLTSCKEEEQKKVIHQSEEAEKTDPTDDALEKVFNVAVTDLTGGQSGMAEALRKRIETHEGKISNAKVILIDGKTDMTKEQAIETIKAYKEGASIVMMDMSEAQMMHLYTILESQAWMSIQGVPSLLSENELNRLRNYFSKSTLINSLDNKVFDVIAFNNKDIFCLDLKNDLKQTGNTTEVLRTDNSVSNQNEEYILPEGNPIDFEDTNIILTAYHFGSFADGIVDWVNDTNIVGGTGSNLDDILNAQHVRYTYAMVYPRRGASYHTASASSAITVDYYIHSLYSFKDNKDYYVVRQVITSENNRIYSDIEKEKYWINNDDNTWRYTYGAFMNTITSECDLNTPAELLESAPATMQGSTTVSTSVSYSIGGSISGNLSANPGAMFGLNFSGSVTNGTSRSIPDIGIVHNRNGQKATWTYNGHIPCNRHSGIIFIDYYHDDCVPILRNTCTVENNMIWSVSNPSDKYTLNANTNVITALLLSKDDDYSDKYVRCDNAYSQKIVMDSPARSYQEDWSMQVVKYGDLTGDITKTSYFREYLATNFRETWKPEVKLYDDTDASTNSGKTVFHNFCTAFHNRMEEMKATGFTGEFTFNLLRGGKVVDTFSCTISKQ